MLESNIFLSLTRKQKKKHLKKHLLVSSKLQRRKRVEKKKERFGVPFVQN